MKILAPVTTKFPLNAKTVVTLTGVAYMHADDHADENPHLDTAVQCDLSEVWYGKENILPVLNEIAEDGVQEMKDALLLVGWKYFREKQEAEEREPVLYHEEEI